MQKLSVGLASLLALFALSFAADPANEILTLETPHYRVGYIKKYSQLAGEVLKVAESVWPTLAKAYDSYDRYQRIDILIYDYGDDANGFAIYNFSRVVIFAPHMDWVMRNRQLWIQNVVTHELSHVFSLRRAAWLSPVDAVDLYGSTVNYSDNVNYSFHIPWIPLIAPTWYVEGIAQFEAYMNGNDSWDSQRDMVLRDAYLTGTLPTLDFIETFEDDEDWTQAERCYNTGYAFLIYLKDRFGADKVRDLAKPKALNFSIAAEDAFGKPLTVLFEDFKRSLADRYADFKTIPPDAPADRDMKGGFQQNLAFSSDGRFMAWLGNDEDRRYPLNWIFWKDLSSGSTVKSGKPADKPAAPAPAAPAPSPSPTPTPKPDAPAYMESTSPFATGLSLMPAHRFGNPALALGQVHNPALRATDAPFRPAANLVRESQAAMDGGVQRSDEIGSAGLEFNHDNTRLLTTRQDREAQYTDIWEYEFRSKKSEDEKWHRLTWEERASYPSYHPTKNLIVYSRKKNGSSNLAVLDSAGRTWQITNFSNGEQVYNPRYTPRGDSIYFTYGNLDKEAIVAVSAGAPAFNPFLAVKDSSLFPDSLALAKNQKFTFVTPMKRGGIRNLRFSGDTLFWSSNMEDSVYSVYDVYARVPGDSAVYRATHVASQALEPLPREGVLYYQGYVRQQFRLFQQPLALARTGDILRAPKDSLPVAKAKKEDYSKLLETGEYDRTKVALDITPYLSLQPQFIADNKTYTDVALGLSLTFGEAYGTWMQSLSGAITKRANPRDPLNYQFSYEGAISSESIRHTTLTWPVTLYYSLYHDIVQVNDFQGQSFIAFQGIDTLTVTQRFWDYDLFTRDAASAAMPLPYNFVLGASYFRQALTLESSSEQLVTNHRTGLTDSLENPRANFLKDANQHKHYDVNLGWSWSKGMIGTYLPTGGGVWAQLHKYWSTYYQGSVDPIDSVNMISLELDGKSPPQAVFPQAEFNPWALEVGTGAVYSVGKAFSLFANAEGDAFLNKLPTTRTLAHVSANGKDSIFTDQAAGGLWVMTYRLGYYRMSGYPYNFNYRGRDIMEGSSMAFGQAGIEIPIKAGLFIPDLPTSSLKQFLITGVAEAGTTLLTAPDNIYEELDKGDHNLLMDFGLRFSANFHLYHQLPFTMFVQGFVPYNQLKSDNLYWFDYPHTPPPNADGSPSAAQLANDAADRKAYMKLVQDPRFYVGFNLGLF